MRFCLLISSMVLTGAALGTGVNPAAQPGTAAPSSPPAQTLAKAPAALSVRGAGLKDLDLSMADLKAMPHRTITVKEKDDKPVAYSGVLVEDVLVKAGMAFGQAFRGPKLRDYLLAEAGDGYAVVFALPEISTEFSERVVVIADAAGGNPLNEKDGPLKIIVSDEKKHARWVRNVMALTVHTCAPEK